MRCYAAGDRGHRRGARLVPEPHHVHRGRPALRRQQVSGAPRSRVAHGASPPVAPCRGASLSVSELRSLFRSYAAHDSRRFGSPAARSVSAPRASPGRTRAARSRWQCWRRRAGPPGPPAGPGLRALAVGLACGPPSRSREIGIRAARSPNARRALRVSGAERTES
jgi:hypothetical protein